MFLIHYIVEAKDQFELDTRPRMHLCEQSTHVHMYDNYILCIRYDAPFSSFTSFIRYDAPDGMMENSRRQSLSYQPQSQNQQVIF